MFRLDIMQAYDSDEDEDDLQNSANSQDSDKPFVDIDSLGKAFEEALLVESSANLYALGMRDFIDKIHNSYHDAALKMISTGFAMEPWTERKIKLFERPKAIIEEVLKTCQAGSEAKAQLITDIDTFEKEAIAAARQEYQSKANTMPKEGSMEIYYIPAIKKSIDIIYRTYFLFQITDKSREDSRSSLLVQAAEAFARKWSAKLLHKIDEKSLRQSEQILTDIEASCRKMIRNTTAARGTIDPDSEDKPDIDRVQLLMVNGAFAKKNMQVEKRALERANANIGTIVKKTAYAAGRAVGTTASMIGSAAHYLGDKVGDYWVPSQGPKSSDQTAGSSSSQSNSNNVDFSVAQVEQKPVVISDYDPDANNNAKNSPVSKTSLRQAPSAQRSINQLLGAAKDDDELLEETTNNLKI